MYDVYVENFHFYSLPAVERKHLTRQLLSVNRLQESIWNLKSAIYSLEANASYVAQNHHTILSALTQIQKRKKNSRLHLEAFAL